MSSDPIQQLIDAGAIPASPFASNSRYNGVGIALHGNTAYVRRRFIPQRRDIQTVGEYVVRALEHCAAASGGIIRPGEGMATNRIGRYSAIRVVDAIVSGTHEPETSHYELLRAFIDVEILHRVDRELATHDYRTHEFGDSVLIERTRLSARSL